VKPQRAQKTKTTLFELCFVPFCGSTSSVLP
jgi:hypothetical protein